jgi:hypothetical protein
LPFPPAAFQFAARRLRIRPVAQFLVALAESKMHKRPLEGQSGVMFDGTFTLMKSFDGPEIPSDFAPYGIQNINGDLNVTYTSLKK